MKAVRDSLGLYRLANLRAALHDSDRKTLPRMLSEFMSLSIRRRCVATHYLTAFLYKQSAINCENYLSSKEIRHLQEAMCSPEAVDILQNKLLFQEYYGTRHFPLPRLLAYNFKDILFVRNKGRWVGKDIRETAALYSIVRELSADFGGTKLFAKQVKGSCGAGARRFLLQADGPDGSGIRDLHEYLLSGSFLLQEEVVQARAMGAVNPSSLNTIRIDTCRFDGEAPEILSALLRVGRKGSDVDNIAAGGIFVGIDPENGALRKVGFSKLSKGGHTYERHPDTGTVFEGFRLPFFKEARELALRAAGILPQALVGWDVAISSSGPVLIEGNAIYYDMQLSDVAYGGYRRNGVYQRLVAEAGKRAHGN